MAVAPGNKRLSVTINVDRQRKLNEIKKVENKTTTQLFNQWIDTTYALTTSWNKKIGHG